MACGKPPPIEDERNSCQTPPRPLREGIEQQKVLGPSPARTDICLIIGLGELKSQ